MLSATVESTIRKMYPTGSYDEIAVDLIDAHLSVPALKALLHEVNHVPGVCADVDLDESEKSTALYVGLRTAPSWAEFNRDYTERQRVSAVRERGALTYWIVRLSRIGPFWTSYWNEFRNRNGRIMPEISLPPKDEEWVKVVNRIPNVLSAFSLDEIPPGELITPVPWISPPDITIQTALFHNAY
jgi:hypothetical protein